MNDTEPSDAQGRGARKLTWLAANSGKMLILALIYGAMNLLSFVSLQRIDAAAFTVCAQLKILTTAFFSVVVLGRKLTWTKWNKIPRACGTGSQHDSEGFIIHAQSSRAGTARQYW